MKKGKKLVPYTLTSPFKIITLYADIRNVIWNQSEIIAIKIKNYWKMDSDFPENIVYKFPNIPKELIDYIQTNKEAFETV